MKRADPQPVSVEIKLTDDLFIKTAVVAKAGTVIPTHAHAYDHVTLLAVGRMAVWVDEDMLGDYTGPCGILIRAHKKHSLVTMTDGVVFACIHALHGTEGVEIEEEHIVQAED
jgi:quercetin dioxygenase-like cupin family protein